jgi:hypothetical protein
MPFRVHAGQLRQRNCLQSTAICTHSYRCQQEVTVMGLRVIRFVCPLVQVKDVKFHGLK